MFLTNLIGTLPTTLGQLTNLEHLQVLTNSISKTIPTELGLLNKLVMLSLSVNSLTGCVLIKFTLIFN